MRRPFAWPATLFIAGILLADFGVWNFTAFIVTAFVLTVAGLAIPLFRSYLLAGAIIATGGATLSLQTRVVAPNDLRRIVGPEPQIVAVRGMLIESPYYRYHDRGSREQALAKMEAHAVRLRVGDEWQRVCGRIA